MDTNFEFLNSISEIPIELFEKLRSMSDFKIIPAGTQIIKLNEITTKAFLLVKGAVRCYATTESGKEFNKSFYFDSSFVGSLTALLKRQPSAFGFECITDCEIYEADYYQVMDLSKEYPYLKDLYIKVLEKVYVAYEKRLVDMISLDATERYLELKSRNPDIDSQISQYHIASYLGITPVQLSRIRKKIGKD